MVPDGAEGHHQLPDGARREAAGEREHERAAAERSCDDQQPVGDGPNHPLGARRGGAGHWIQSDMPDDAGTSNKPRPVSLRRISRKTEAVFPLIGAASDDASLLAKCGSSRPLRSVPHTRRATPTAPTGALRTAMLHSLIDCGGRWAAAPAVEEWGPILAALSAA